MLDKSELNDDLYDSDDDDYLDDDVKTGNVSSLDARRRIEELQEERRLRKEIEDYYSF